MANELLLFIEIMLINIVLSGDNAVVIGMASMNLPEHQKKRAIWWGAFGAVFLRIALTAAAVILLHIPLIQAIGAFFLVYISIQLLLNDGNPSHIKTAASLGGAIRTIIAADFIMSLDNVLAVAAVADGNFVMILIGMACSIPLIIWGSTFIVRLLERFPFLVYMGAGVLGYTAGEMFVKDIKVQQLFALAHPSFHWAVPLLFTLIVIFSGVFFRKSCQ